MSGMLKVLLDILSEPSIIIGTVVFVGLILQGKSFSQTITPTIKAIVGYLVIAAAAGIITMSLNPMGKMIEYGFQVKGVIPNNEAIVAVAISKYGQTTALIMTFGMVINLLIARFSRYKYIFLTGHITLYLACMLAVILTATSQSVLFAVINGALALGLIMIISPAICQKGMQAITGGNDFAMGHSGGVGYAISSKVGKIVGKNSSSIETMNVPQSISFLRDSTVAISLTMVVIYLICTITAGPEFVENELGVSKNYIVFAIIQALTFSAGFIVIQTGVRMILAEIVPAFKGISEKLVPDAIPALDCPLVFPFAPNAVVIGFISSFIGGMVAMVILGLVGAVVIIPGVVPHFFTGATAGVFGNATGGRRGTVFGAFVNGLLISFLPVFMIPYLSSIGFTTSTFSDTDMALSGTILGYFSSITNEMMLMLMLLLIISLLIIVKNPIIKTNN